MANESKTLKSEAKRLANALRKVPGLQVERTFDHWSTEARGYGCAVAAWPGFAPVHLYFDRAAGEQFRFWAGFDVPSGADLDHILTSLPESKRPTKEMTEKNLYVFRNGDWKYKNPKKADLAWPYVERYDEYGAYYFGFYDWGAPITDKSNLGFNIGAAAKFIKSIVGIVGHSSAKKRKKPRPIIDPEKKAAVENAAIKSVKKHFQAKGFGVKSRETDNCGWDLDVTNAELELRAEVKGLSGAGLTVELSPNEFEAMQDDSDSYRICIVSNALLPKRRKVRVFRLSGNRWISDDKDRLKVQEQTAARLTIVPK